LYKGFLSVEKNKGKILYTDTDSIIAEFDRNIDNEIHGDLFWDISKKDTKIKDAVFCNPKSYGLKFFDNTEIVKIKGIQRNYINFDELKHSFYNNKMLSVSNITQIKNNNFKLEYRTIEKKINLIAYNKRKFNKELISTSPYWYENGIYS
jgi:hypothetical protein